jgi:hypothetical protein
MAEPQVCYPTASGRDVRKPQPTPCIGIIDVAQVAAA